jgi:hypothetical protein
LERVSGGRRERIEWLKCDIDCAYFLDSYGWIFNATLRAWVPFRLWGAQFDVLDQLVDGSHYVVLKARQLGLTWLCLGYALWLMLFRPAAVVLLFSQREDEAQALLDRLKKMYSRLPRGMQCRRVVKENLSEFELSNGSTALCFPTTGGRSYTGTLVLADEADYIPNLNEFLNAVKPTVDAGGQLLLVSTADKAQPGSTFKRLFRAAWQGVSDEYRAIFLPWSARPERSQDWYSRIARDMREQDGSDDNLHQEYPDSPEQALSARTLDKRIPAHWVERVSAPAHPWPGACAEVPPLTGLALFRLPQPGHWYALGVDPAEGNPTSDESAICVLDVDSGEQVAVLAGRLQPASLADSAAKLAAWYNGATIMVERNNHGHSVLLWLAENTTADVAAGPDHRPGWLSNVKGKALMYDALTEACRDAQMTLHDETTLTQMANLDGSTLRAPAGEHDDRVDALALAWAASLAGAGQGASVVGAPVVDAIAAADGEGW